MLDAARADALAESLGLELSQLAACPMCLLGVGHALQSGDEAALRSALRFFAPALWDEGLDVPIREALAAAERLGVPHAAAAAAEVERFGAASRVVKAVVRRLAEQQLEEIRRLRPGNGRPQG